MSGRVKKAGLSGIGSQIEIAGKRVAGKSVVEKERTILHLQQQQRVPVPRRSYNYSRPAAPWLRRPYTVF